MQFLITLIWTWLKDAQFHKTAASAAAGTSIGMMTVLGILEQKIDTVKAEVKYEMIAVKSHIIEVDNFVKSRKELTDERFNRIEQDFTYVKKAIDVTNQNILNLSQDLKRNRN